MSEWIAVAPLAILMVSGLVVMMLDAFVGENAELALVSSCALIASAAISASLLISPSLVVPAPDLFSRYLANDDAALFFDIVICGGAALCALLAGGYLREHRLERGEFYVLLIFTSLGAMLLVRAIDLLTVFVGLETMSLGIYSLVAFRRTSARAVEGAVKYFLLGSFAAAVLLFGSALVYGASGATDFATIRATVASGEAQTSLIAIGMVMMLIGLAFKVSAVPFHAWAPDAYEGAVTPVSTYMSVAIKSAAFMVLLRVMLLAFGDPMTMTSSSGWLPIIGAISVLTMVFGNFAALAQTSVKRMLAYSSISHAGYVLVGLAAVPAVGQKAISAIFYYLAAYTASKVLAFGSLILLGSNGREVVSYRDIAGAGRRNPIAAIPFILAVLTLLGFPPTAGFFAKYNVFSAALSAGGWVVWLAVLGVLLTAVSAYYYLKVLVYLFMREPAKGDPIAVPMRSSYVVWAIAISSFFVVHMGIAPSWYLDLALGAAASLFL